MAFDRSNVFVDRYVRGNGYDIATGERMYSLTQIKDANLKVTIDNSTDIVDAEGAKVETLERGISAQFSASNAFFSFDLFANQIGVKVKDASEQAKITVPMWEEHVLAAGATTSIELKQEPVGVEGAKIPFIYVVPAGGGTSKSYGIGAEANATNFTLTAKTLTLPTGLNAGDKVYVDYEYENSVGFKISNYALDKTKEHKFVARQVFPRAKFSQEIDQNFAPDADHPFVLNMTQDICSTDRKLFDFLFDGNAYAK